MRNLFLTGPALLLGLALHAQDLSARPDREDGQYKSGDVVKWTVTVTNGALTNAAYAIKTGGLKVARQGVLQFHEGRGQCEFTLNRPDWVLLEVSATNSQGKAIRALGSALCEGERIRPSADCPEDFDAFWQEKIVELREIPENAVVVPGDAGRASLEYFTVTLDNIRGSKIRGQLARPAQPGPLPALLIVQWAGVYPLQKAWVTDRAAEGWLTLNIIAHDLPIAEPEAFYREKSDGPLNDYPRIGNDSRETSYFLRMYLSCVRAADYLAGRPDWNGKVLAVTGGSQGGLQAIMTAGLHPKITAVLACVPAGCDNTALDAERAPGWPMWMWKADGKDPAKVKQASRYYDVVNFAARVKCPVLIGVGGIDTVCPPPGIFAAFGQLQTDRKEMLYMPLADHMGKHDAYYKRFNAWLAAARQQATLPPN